MPNLAIGLIGASGVSLAAVGTVVAQAAPDSSSVAAYVFGGGATLALAGLVVEVARRMMNGTLIPRQVKDYMDELGAAIVAQGHREAESMAERESMRHEREAMRRHAEDINRTAEELRAEVRRLVRIIEEKN